MKKEITYQMNLADWPVSDNGSVRKVMTRELNLSRKEISRLKFDGEILLNGERIRVNDRMRVGDTLTLRFPEVSTGEYPVVDAEPDILYEDEDVVVVNKPAGIPCHPVHGHLDDSMGTILQSYYSRRGETDFVIRPVGRLDKDVSGAILYAKNRLAAARLSKDREEGKLNKDYTAFVSGIFDIKQGMIDAPIAKTEGERRRITKDPSGKPAVTIFRVVNEFHVRDASVSELEVEIETGRTHQIRAHMSAAGHPLIGDELYGGTTEIMNRPALHCARIAFLTPFTREQRVAIAPLPADMEALLQTSFAPDAELEAITEPEEPAVTEEPAAAEPPVSEPEPIPENPNRAGDAILAALKQRESRLSSNPPEQTEAEFEPRRDRSRLRGVMTVLLSLIFVGALGSLIFWITTQRTAQKGLTAEEKQAIYETLTIQFRDDSTVEYGGDFHASDYVLAAGGDLSCEGTVDTMKTGDQTVVYTVTKTTDRGYSVNRKYEKVFTVKDLMGPIISLSKSIVQIAPGDAYDPKTNVESVLDPVDGRLDFEVDTGGFDASRTGTYVIRVNASDRFGNRTVKAFKVIVGERSETAEATPEPSASPTPSPSPTPSAAPADVTAPVIALSAESAVLNVGDSFSPGSLIASVTDETDGTLAYAETLAPGSFTVVSNVDTGRAGAYTVTVTALDKAGNRSERTIAVTVNEPKPTPTPGSSVPNSSDPKGQIYNFLTGTMGLNRAQACGILANMHRESRFNSTADNGVGYYGLCQWGGERKDNLFTWCKNNGYDPETIDGQLHFLQYEMPLYYPNTTAQLKACPNDEDGARRACWIFAIGYEVAGETYAEMSMDKAAEYFNE